MEYYLALPWDLLDVKAYDKNNIYLSKTEESVNFPIDSHLKIGFAYSKPSALVLIVDHCLRRPAVILCHVVFNSSERWYLFNRPKI